MKLHNNKATIAIQTALLCLAFACKAATVTTFYPAPQSASLRFDPKASSEDILISTYPPTDHVLILGELSIVSGSNASLHELMVAALGEAKARGADFVALANSGAQPSLFLGKMVPAGHGRSMFVPGTIQGSEIGRIAAIPSKNPGSIRLVLGRYSRSAS